MKKLSFAFALFIIFLGADSVTAQRKKSNLTPQVGARVVNTETLPQQIERIARFYGLDPRLFHSLVYTESVFKSQAVSYKGAACYTQLMPDTARRFGLRVDSQVDERFNSEKCLSVGAYYLAWLLKVFRGDVRLALAGYNAGEGAVMKFGWRIPPYRETVQYVEKICALYLNQTGHAVAMAYNQPLAQIWTNALYSARGNRTVPRIVQPTAYLQPSSSGAVPPVSTINAGGTEYSAAVSKTTEPKKLIVNRVSIEQSAPRIRTQSLSFGN